MAKPGRSLNGYGISGTMLDRAYPGPLMTYSPYPYPDGGPPTFDFMTYSGGEPQWISPNHWNDLIKAFADPSNATGPPATSVAQPTAARRPLAVVASLADTRDPAHAHAHILAPALCACKPSKPDTGARYQFAMLDGDGRLLARTGAPAGPLSTGGTIIEAPLTPLAGARGIELLTGSTPLHRRGDRRSRLDTSWPPRRYPRVTADPGAAGSSGRGLRLATLRRPAPRRPARSTAQRCA